MPRFYYMFGTILTKYLYSCPNFSFFNTWNIGSRTAKTSSFLNSTSPRFYILKWHNDLIFRNQIWMSKNPHIFFKEDSNTFMQEYIFDIENKNQQNFLRCKYKKVSTLFHNPAQFAFILVTFFKSQKLQLKNLIMEDILSIGAFSNLLSALKLTKGIVYF